MTTESGTVAQDKITSGVQLVVLVSLVPPVYKGLRAGMSETSFPPFRGEIFSVPQK